ncbi:MAG TPA: hypothetical protein VM802_01035 [Chitinophaga sp.]|uniref:hypothetical protein n=1 Tax=Chitinophaga sp. TaxID=1869181 RepID=UPI002BBEC52C|nr:hypothetical protein [Chitinophaga sp.]HVI43416.1 hypothetical protein [Chitinophaga sp.]
MTTQLWIGLGFLAILILFMMKAFFAKDPPNENQAPILRLFIALAAGFAGGFLTGDALFRLDSSMGNGTKLLVSGTAGAALFFTAWFTAKSKLQPPPDGFSFSVASGWTFEQAVAGIARSASELSEITGFTPEQRAAVLESRELTCRTPKEAIEKLRYLNPALPQYSVDYTNGVYSIKA